MLINDCCFTKDNKCFIVHELKIYEVSEKDMDIINFERIDVQDHVNILKYFKPSTLNLHKWETLTHTSIIPSAVKSFNDHFVMVRGFIYKIKNNDATLVKSIEKMQNINLISDEFASVYNINPMENFALEFMESVDNSVIDLTNFKVSDGVLSLDKFIISNNPDKLKNLGDNIKPVYVPYIIQLIYFKRYNDADMFNLFIYFLLKCNTKKLFINNDISHIDYADDINGINRLVINTYSAPMNKIVLHEHFNVGKKLIVLLHLGNLYQIKYFVKNLAKIKCSYTLFVTVTTKTDKGCVTEILAGESFDMLSLFFKKLKVPVRYFETANVGLDVGPFLLMVKFINDNKIPCDYALKLHTKAEKTWRDVVIDPLVSDHPINTLKKLETNKILGFNNVKYDHLNHVYTCFFLNKLGIKVFPEQDMIFSKSMYSNVRQNTVLSKTNKNKEKFTFIPGTCFWFDPSVIIKNRLWELYSYLPEDHVNDSIYQQTPHALKRLICILYQL